MVALDAVTSRTQLVTVVAVQYFSGTAEELHALPMPTQGDEPELWVMQPTTPALVMGSSQKPEQFDRERLVIDGVELATRRSGGGAVFIDPAATVWLDLVTPRSSAWWSSELAENFLIVGRVWQTALASLQVDTDLCTSAPDRSDDARLVCWAGVGWGELTLAADESGRQAKVIGLSQRRTRWGARVQAMAVVDASNTRASDYFVDPTVGPEITPVSLSVSRSQVLEAALAAFAAQSS